MMAHRNSDSLTVSEKSSSLRSTASRQTADTNSHSDTNSTASVDSDGQESVNICDGNEQFRAIGGEVIMTVGDKSTG